MSFTSAESDLVHPPGHPLAVVDIDGVIADVRHRLHYLDGASRDWDGFFSAAVDDVPLPQGLAAIREALSEGLDLAYLTGRPERCRASTEGWLRQHGFPMATIHMRSDRDRRPARVYKVEALRSMARERPVARVIDDDAAVVRAIREAGFVVVHATWMGGGDQPTLFDAQENEGRT